MFPFCLPGLVRRPVAKGMYVVEVTVNGVVTDTQKIIAE
jgi:hypothetical protein